MLIDLTAGLELNTRNQGFFTVSVADYQQPPHHWVIAESGRHCSRLRSRNSSNDFKRNDSSLAWLSQPDYWFPGSSIHSVSSRVDSQPQLPLSIRVSIVSFADSFCFSPNQRHSALKKQVSHSGGFRQRPTSPACSHSPEKTDAARSCFHACPDPEEEKH